MMAAWSIAQERLTDSEPIPVRHSPLFHNSYPSIHSLAPCQLYHFARDDRAYKGFTTRLAEHKSEINRNMTKQLKWQMNVLEVALEGKRETMRRKVEVVREALDDGVGVRPKTGGGSTATK